MVSVGGGGEALCPHPSQQEACRVEIKVHPFLSRRDFANCTHHSCFSPISQNLLTWPHLATGKDRKCTFYQPCSQLPKEEKEKGIKGI